MRQLHLSTVMELFLEGELLMQDPSQQAWERRGDHMDVCWMFDG